VVVCAQPKMSDVWVEYAAIATLLLHLEAHDLGLGSCWVQVRLREHDEQQSAQEYIAEALGLDPATAVEAMVAIGYPAETEPGHPTSSLPHDKVSFEKERPSR
jgi:nitroreductase